MGLVSLRGVRVVIFDLDDTLYPERSFVFSGFEAVSTWLRERFACPVDPAARMRQVFETGERRHVFDVLLEELGCQPASELIPQMLACYRAHAPSIRLYPDADDVLSRWTGCYRLGLISDGPLAVQQAKVRALGLEPRLDPIVLTDQWGAAYWKPHTRAFEYVEAVTGSSATACVYIADNPAKDFVGARARKWQTVRVARADGIYSRGEIPPGFEPDAIVGSLCDITMSA